MTHCYAATALHHDPIKRKMCLATTWKENMKFMWANKSRAEFFGLRTKSFAFLCRFPTESKQTLKNWILIFHSYTHTHTHTSWKSFLESFLPLTPCSLWSNAAESNKFSTSCEDNWCEFPLCKRIVGSGWNFLNYFIVVWIWALAPDWVDKSIYHCVMLKQWCSIRVSIRCMRFLCQQRDMATTDGIFAYFDDCREIPW